MSRNYGQQRRAIVHKEERAEARREVAREAGGGAGGGSEPPFARMMRMSRDPDGDDEESVLTGVIARFIDPTFVFVVERVAVDVCESGCNPKVGALAVSTTMEGAIGALRRAIYDEAESYYELFRNSWVGPPEAVTCPEHPPDDNEPPCDSMHESCFKRDLDAALRGDVNSERAFDSFKNVHGDMWTEDIAWVESRTSTSMRVDVLLGGHAECCSADLAYRIVRKRLT